jgi:hypothetical protein
MKCLKRLGLLFIHTLINILLFSPLGAIAPLVELGLLLIHEDFCGF